MRTVAIISSDFGGIDYVHREVDQDYAYDFIKYREHNTPYPFPNLDNRTKSKYFKMQMHRLMRYDIYIWVDASVQIIDSSFVSKIVKYLESGYDIVNFIHPQRKSVYEEIDYMIHEMRKGNHYVISRYGHQKLSLEKAFLQRMNYPNSEVPLLCGYCFAVKNISKCNNAFDEWWERSLQFSNFDQNFLSYIIWKHKLRSKQLPSHDGMLIRHKHIQYDTY